MERNESFKIVFIEQVKVELYVKGHVVTKLVFNGGESDYMNWFSISKATTKTCIVSYKFSHFLNFDSIKRVCQLYDDMHIQV